ncbi:hypothetical protein BCR36DRAFT_461792 [Piromyces finnis]|uniref:Helicase ATP-binding domain-containing protein n=1 Tax=Piromyces finnis TaxID=1754191 RepID=A0A1Y1UX99_9FUNG|nr:hypothetical protein BCR36DRAFT_461792 [Piromyces finnis]|eukprot:ORX42806.1 hypothetical protein BCR36DRAFT_461792 [Piromyces finnis]
MHKNEKNIEFFLTNNSSTSSKKDDDDDDELDEEIKLMHLTEKLNPKDKLLVLCKARMTIDNYQKFLNEQHMIRGQWICYHIMSFGSIRKEYKTLLTLTEKPSLPICNIITSGNIKSINNDFKIQGQDPMLSDDITNNIIDEYHLNPSQANVLKKVKNRKLSLVQGPPGTGKTTTIIATIIRELTESFLTNNPFKILVCTPSNYACDEIAKRLEKEKENKEYIRPFRCKADNNLTEIKLEEELNKANVVICTLYFSGNKYIRELLFNFLIIDEACQCTELTCLILFCYNINQAILIGDPKQLPPIIKSHKIEKCGYGKSLFERIQEESLSEEIFLLNVQYRMHPNISKLSSQCFYDGKIIDGECQVKSMDQRMD